jgi:hypothetical protein
MAVVASGAASASREPTRWACRRASRRPPVDGFGEQHHPGDEAGEQVVAGRGQPGAATEQPAARGQDRAVVVPVGAAIATTAASGAASSGGSAGARVARVDRARGDGGRELGGAHPREHGTGAAPADRPDREVAEDHLPTSDGGGRDRAGAGERAPGRGAATTSPLGSPVPSLVSMASTPSACAR